MANPNPRRENLAPRFGTLSPELQKELSSRGGKSSQAAAKRNRLVREITHEIMTSQAPLSDEQKEQYESEGIDIETVSVILALILELTRKALTGNLSAIEKVLRIWGADIESVLADHKLETENKRLSIENERLKLLQAKLSNDEETSAEDLPNLADLLSNPLPDRSLADLEEDS